MERFEGNLEPVPHGGHFVAVPGDVAEAAGLKHGARVRGTVDGAPYRSSLMKYSGVFHLGVHKATLAAAGAKGGDRVDVTIELDDEPLPTDTVPPDLAKAFSRSPAARAAYERLAPAHKREHVKHVLDAKRPETRARRIEKTIETLASPAPPKAPWKPRVERAASAPLQTGRRTTAKPASKSKPAPALPKKR